MDKIKQIRKALNRIGHQCNIAENLDIKNWNWEGVVHAIRKSGTRELNNNNIDKLCELYNITKDVEITPEMLSNKGKEIADKIQNQARWQDKKYRNNVLTRLGNSYNLDYDLLGKLEEEQISMILLEITDMIATGNSYNPYIYGIEPLRNFIALCKKDLSFKNYNILVKRVMNKWNLQK